MFLAPRYEEMLASSSAPARMWHSSLVHLSEAVAGSERRPQSQHRSPCPIDVLQKPSELFRMERDARTDGRRLTVTHRQDFHKRKARYRPPRAQNELRDS